MSEIRYVCLSDVHFGAENSLLTCLDPGAGEIDVARPSPVLVGLVQCLDHLIGGSSGQRPTLVLHGDIFELALAEANDAFMVFERFLELAFPQGQTWLFDKTILYVPGNHDHHLWELAREAQYVRYLESRTLGERLPVLWHTTRLFTHEDPAPVESSLLNAIIRRHPHLGDLTVRTIYPNLGLLSPSGRRCALVHHGHFTEYVYRLMSVLQDMIFVGDKVGNEISDWEAENFAWIDFLWSTLGGSGRVGQDIALVYDMLQSPRAVRLLTNNLARSIAGRHAGGWLGQLSLTVALRFVFNRIFAHVAVMERNVTGDVLTEDTKRVLALYLEQPLLRQIERERGQTALPSDFLFIFGHTHKPFEAWGTFKGYPSRVALFNSGGWVVDTELPVPKQGAAAILLDSELNAVSLRLYNQGAHPHEYEVRVAGLDDPQSRGLLSTVSSRTDSKRPPWHDFSNTVARAVAERRHALARIIARGERTARQIGRK
jgi:hypothetical protein